MKRRIVAVAGGAVVVAHAVLLAANSLALEPASVAPGDPLAAIYEHVDAMGNSSQQDVIGVLVIAGIGVAVLGWYRRLPAIVVMILHLALIVMGAGAAFQASWFLGMDLADSYPSSGGPQTGWSYVLVATSGIAMLGIAMLGIVAVGVRTAVQTARRTTSAS